MENHRFCGVGCYNAHCCQRCARGVSKADTATNLISVAILLFWTLLSFATNCFTFKNNKNNEKN